MHCYTTRSGNLKAKPVNYYIQEDTKGQKDRKMESANQKEREKNIHTDELLTPVMTQSNSLKSPINSDKSTL